MDGLVVRTANYDDLDRIIARFGDGPLLYDRYARQRSGAGQMLLATYVDQPVGLAFVWLSEAEEPELREYLPGAPILQRLEVAPPFRNKGIGTRIVWAAEDIAVRLRHQYLVLGVGESNTDAIRLYERLGYHNWFGVPVATTRVEFLPDGQSLRHPDTCLIYVKDLGIP